ncbi:MAG: NUDIX hydrolase [Phycisphaerales bacterium]
MTAQGERTTIHRGPKFDYEEVRFPVSGGRTVTRQYVKHPGAVCICPVLDGTEGREIVFIRNTRFTVDRELLELPAGTLEPGEPVDVCAGRELIEETGYESSELVPLGSFFTTPGMTDEVMHAYAGLGLTHVGQRLEPDERIVVERVPVARALEWLDSGELADAKSIVTLVRALRRGMLEG